MVTGNASPLIANSELFTLTEETVTLAPVALSVPVCVPLVPTVTFPTPIVAGLTLNSPWIGACSVPAPLNEMVRLGFEAFELTVTLPLKLPEDCGAKVTLKGTVCPAVKVTGVLSPEMLKPAPLTVTWVIVRSDAPELLSASDWLWLVPVCTLPNPMLVGAALNVPGNGSPP